MLRIQTDSRVPLRIFSKYTPANPDEQQAHSTATRPTTGLRWAASGRPAAGASGHCTRATPAMSTKSETHFIGAKRRPSSTAEKTAAARILSWYVIWYVAAERLESATKSRLFCTVYSTAGTARSSVPRHCTKTSWFTPASSCRSGGRSSSHKSPSEPTTLKSSDMTTAVELR